MIDEPMERRLLGAIRQKLEELECTAIAVGIMPDHVHVLFGFPPKSAIAEVVGKVKGSSSHLLNHTSLPVEHFKWQGAYGAFTVSRSGLAKVRDYILNQKAHHAGNVLHATWEMTSIEDTEVTSDLSL